MIHWWRACWAMTSLTLCEIGRQKTWLVLIAAIAVMLATLASLGAVDTSAQLKLSVSTISGSINFISTLFAILLVAATITRDREQLVSLTLFSKPLPMSAYVWGRWLGVQLALAIGIISLNAIGSLVVSFKSEQPVPEMRAVQAPVAWQQVDLDNVAKPIDAKRCTLAGSRKGMALRWQMTGLAQRDMILLIKGRLRSVDPAHLQSLIEVHVLKHENGEKQLLSLAPTTPYGARLIDGQDVQAGQAMMRDKGYNHQDLNQDYMQFHLPAAAIAPDGTCFIQLTRTGTLANLSFELEKSCLVALSGGSFFVNMQRGGLVVLAQVGYLNAIALLCACFSNIAVTLLAGLTAFFGALILSYIQEMTPKDKLPGFVTRFLDLTQVIIPDFNFYGVEALLAGGRSIAWTTVMDAWMYYGAYSLGFLLIAWVLMARREL